MKKGFLTKALVAVGVMVSALALSSVCAFAAEYVLDASTLTKGDITSNTAVDNIFTINATNATKENKTELAQHWTVEKSSGSYVTEADSITGSAITGRLKSNGTGHKEYRSITVTVDYPAEVTIQGISSKNKTTRTLQLYDSKYTAIESKKLTNNGNSIGTTSFWIDKGTYYLGSTDSGFNIYAIKVTTYEGTADSKVAVVSDGTNYYAVALISEAQATSSDVDSIILTSAGASDTSTEIYNEVTINGTDYTASQLGGGKYVYAVQVTDSTSASDIQAGIAISFANSTAA